MSSENATNSDAFAKWLLGIVASLIAAGVVALWSMSGNVARLDERVALWTQVFEKRFDAAAKSVDDVTRRLDRLELRRDAVEDRKGTHSRP